MKQVSWCDTINDIKQRIQDAEGHPPVRQHIVFNDMELRDDRTLFNCNIQKEYILDLMISGILTMIIYVKMMTTEKTIELK